MTALYQKITALENLYFGCDTTLSQAKDAALAKAQERHYRNFLFKNNAKGHDDIIAESGLTAYEHYDKFIRPAYMNNVYGQL